MRDKAHDCKHVRRVLLTGATGNWGRTALTGDIRVRAFAIASVSAPAILDQCSGMPNLEIAGVT